MRVTLFIFAVLTVLCGIVTAKDERQLAANKDSTSCMSGGSPCFGAGDNDGYADIKADACYGQNACLRSGYGGYATISSGSCHQLYACANAGLGGRATVGSNSCLQDYACFRIGSGAVATIGSGSCVGINACKYLGMQGKKIEIGSNSCNCHYCCECLGDGSYVVPDNSCNDLGVDECCKSATEKGNKASATLPPTESPKAAPSTAPTSSKKYSLKLISIAISD
mmetsp:Transcript_22056/g.32019  ORF Transcript_22056/g.32019 Transcript_22056/m.32019 type:complete len:224 (-) Transcript_22056:142-813(-)